MWVAPLQGSQASREVGATALPPASLGLAGLCSDNTAVAGPLQLSRAQFPCWPHYGIGPCVDTDELTPQMPPGRSPRLQWPNSCCVRNQLKESFLLSQTLQEFLVTGRGSDSGPQPLAGKGATSWVGMPSSSVGPARPSLRGSSEQLAWLRGIFSYRSSPPPSPQQSSPNQTRSRQVGLGFCQPPGQQGWVGRLGPVSAVLPGPRPGWEGTLVLISRLHFCASLCCHKQRSQPHFLDGESGH
ncbi:hCG1646817, isoform CRA_d [Homo sapiens]|uniref:HCG1646817, isoform CRA_d n=1 Tax=Homo sapiens TaxID=9606 RepID=Q8N9G7_HUMAN|nr:hCG1646817, isoform CRA_d [Homo sapiens]BAC04367.1 unnamed protein product [Homo sapiens]